MDIITIDSILNHGTVVQVIGHDADGHVRSVVGDWRPMLHAIDGLGLEPGSTVAVIDTDDGPALCEPDAD